MGCWKFVILRLSVSKTMGWFRLRDLVLLSLTLMSFGDLHEWFLGIAEGEERMLHNWHGCAPSNGVCDRKAGYCCFYFSVG